MRRLYTSLFFLSLLFLVLSCDDSFLDENKKSVNGYTLDTSLFVNPIPQFTEVSITLADLKNKDFKVIQYPTIIHFESLKGHIDESGKLTFKIKVDHFESQINLQPQSLGVITIDIEEFGFLSIPVEHLNRGNAVLQLNKTEIDFSTLKEPASLVVSNESDGYLLFAVTDFPQWVKVTTIYGEDAKDREITIHPHGQIEFKLTRNDRDMSPGNYEGDIVLLSNARDNPRRSIKVKMTIRENRNGDNIIAVKGDIVDCEFNKETGILYLAVGDENKVYAFDVQSSKIVNEITLKRNVYGISLSEDRETLFVGQSALVSLFDTKNLNEISEIETDFIANDVIDGGNGYYYISKKDGNYETYFYSYNIATGKLSPSGTYIDNMEGSSLLKLVNQPYLLVTRPNTSPNGLTLADITGGKPVWKKYWHQSFGDKLWQSENGNFIVGRQGIIFKTPTVNSPDPINFLGVLPPDQSNRNDEYGFPYAWLDINATTHSIWGIYNNYWDIYNLQPRVVEWDDNTYRIRRYIPFEDYYMELNSVKEFHSTLPHYLFASKKGDKLVLVKNILDKSGSYEPKVIRNAWHLEIIELSN